MCQLLETIKVSDGQFRNLPLHEARFNQAREQLWQAKPMRLREHLQVPERYRKGRVKCRVLYSKTIEQVAFQPYEIRPVSSLQLVQHDSIDYALKYADRNLLQKLFERRGVCDDILIVKNGLLTDTYYANIVLDDGKGLYTPAQPLLRGTKRALLLQKGVILEKRLRPEDLASFQKVHLINAMLELGECVVHVESVKV